ncbi:MULTISPECIES: glutathione peroxidase [Rhizobium/Agrobacterium group]|uniref:glutathione peroxidase n=1 Tax=Rhizobium/Agrobacterium group TaxID=227290 RepID=UPI000B401A99|nr:MULTISPECIES: glutathione peroxidase [Rhizobium/Agrobacterium group]MCF1448852.1 glutathione peroxidase [Allorhizobium ampelinum]MCF1482937.1 glutathione peroxidase [Allorhizobium ampelinum]NSZ43420.1 glutathione peroxidase [Agrobacterium vitis]NTA27077.1 glutathione peroxidase [Allorhizobium ampelinum]OVE94166.1 glutathione peroxidase [Allorhizobium ampelinum]
MNVHDFSAKDITGRERKLAEFAGKLLLIVNTASKCGFTPQYEGLETLQKRFQDDLVIIGFPCNQFGGQEPGSEAEIASFCDLNFKVSFPMFAKIDVKGNEAHPLYKYLTHEVRGILGTEAIKWNFTKFLVGREGTPIARYAPITKPEEIADDIAKAVKG